MNVSTESQNVVLNGLKFLAGPLLLTSTGGGGSNTNPKKSLRQQQVSAPSVETCTP